MDEHVTLAAQVVILDAEVRTLRQEVAELKLRLGAVMAPFVDWALPPAGPPNQGVIHVEGDGPQIRREPGIDG